MKPGIYKTAFRGLSFSELWRFGGPIGFIFGVFLKLINYTTGEFHLPSSTFQIPLPKEEFAEHLHQKIDKWVTEAKRLGYDQGAYFTVPQSRSSIESIAYIGLNQTTSVFIAYSKTRIDTNGSISYKEATIFSGNISWQDESSTTFVNHKNYMDDPNTTHVRIKAKNLYDLHRSMINHMRTETKIPQNFHSFDEFLSEMKKSTDLSERLKLERGLYVLKQELPTS